MFQKLHIQLTLFCTFICGIILAFMSFICLSVSETELKERNFAEFQININMLVNHLENQNIISHNWLSQFCADTQFEVDIRDNGSHLVFDTLIPFTFGENDFALVRQKAKETYGFLEESISADSILSSHEEFQLFVGGTLYYGAMALIPKNGGALNIAVLSPLSSLEETILFQRFLFVWADIGGLFLLGIFFWFFTWRMIQPLAKNRQKQAEFIASASHELRSPLTVMLSSLSAMKQASPEEQEHFSKNIEIEGKRMGRLIEDMLTLSGADTSHFSIHKKPAELDTLLLSAYEKFEPLARKKSISISISLPDKIIPPCPCDKERIEQVFSILLDNAISYTPPEGRISLSMEASMERLSFRVSDNGAGIPDAEKKAVFGRFYRCDKSHKDKSHFGLGLCIAQEIIHMHKGKLWIEDTPGGGATFVVVLNL